MSIHGKGIQGRLTIYGFLILKLQTFASNSGGAGKKSFERIKNKHDIQSETILSESP